MGAGPPSNGAADVNDRLDFTLFPNYIFSSENSSLEKHSLKYTHTHRQMADTEGVAESFDVDERKPSDWQPRGSVARVSRSKFRTIHPLFGPSCQAKRAPPRADCVAKNLHTENKPEGVKNL